MKPVKKASGVVKKPKKTGVDVVIKMKGADGELATYEETKQEKENIEEETKKPAKKKKVKSVS